jgi:hypothetical protein
MRNAAATPSPAPWPIFQFRFCFFVFACETVDHSLNYSK